METRTSVIGIVKFKGKILLLKRSLAKKSSPGKWQPVSGFIKEMERRQMDYSSVFMRS